MLCAMPSLRQSSAILASPRNPSRTMRIFSSAEYCRRVALRMSRTVFSALSALAVRVLIVASFGVTMSPNLSLRQSTQSVPQVLTGDNEEQAADLVACERRSARIGAVSHEDQSKNSRECQCCEGT